MLVPPEDRVKFFVFVIESPSPQDLYHERSEGGLLRQAINLDEIPCASRVAINREAFIAAVKVGLREEMAANPGLVPILHISAHGYSDGIQLSCGEVLDWQALRGLLAPVNKALEGALFVCMSTCEGYSGSRMAMFLDDPADPFFAIVGNGGETTWPETAVGFATFYHLIATGHYVQEAVEAMQVASGNNQFFVTKADEARRGFLDFIGSVNLAAAAEKLEAKERGESAQLLDRWLASEQPER